MAASVDLPAFKCNSFWVSLKVTFVIFISVLFLSNSLLYFQSKNHLYVTLHQTVAMEANFFIRSKKYRITSKLLLNRQYEIKHISTCKFIMDISCNGQKQSSGGVLKKKINVFLFLKISQNSQEWSPPFPCYPVNRQCL